MQQATIARAYALYGIRDIHLLTRQKGYRNTSFPGILSNGIKLNFILYKNENLMKERIRRIHVVSRHLRQHGLPVRIPYDPRIITLQASGITQYGALYDYLPGSTIPWEGYTKHHIKLLGMALGRMHAVLPSLQVNNPPHVSNEYVAICDRMAAYFASPGVQKALQHKLGLTITRGAFDFYKDVLRVADKLPGGHMLHMDFVRGNVLFEKATHQDTILQTGPHRISGILDLEKTTYGHPVFDLARTLAFLLVDSKYKTAEEIRKYFLISGYVKRGKQKIPNITHGLSGQKKDLLEILIELFLVHDFYKFLRHNPYESLYENEHYMRTQTLLLEKGCVKK